MAAHVESHDEARDRVSGVRALDALLLVACVVTTIGAALSPAPAPPPLADSVLLLSGVFAGAVIYLAVRTRCSAILAWGWALTTLGLVHVTVWSFALPSDGAGSIQRVLMLLGLPLTAAGVVLTRRSTLRRLASIEGARDQAIEHEHRLRQLFEDSAHGCMITDLGGTIQLANSAAHVLLGRAPETLVDQQVADLGIDHPAAEGSEEGRVEETRFSHPDGSDRRVELFETALRRRDGSIEGSATWLTDVTAQRQGEREREELRARIRQNERLETLGTLTGGIAHDFNNLLAPIIGSTELARLDLAEDSPILEDLDLVRVAADRAKDLATQLLHLSRPERDHVEPVSLEDVLHEALGLLRASMGNTIEIVEQYDSECPPVLATRTQVHQVLFNLCKNAFHAMPSGGTLAASVDLAEALATSESLPPGEGPFVRVRITDTGMGMDADTMERIFDPFFTTKDQQSGTGLGLAMAKSIVTNFRGTISVQSAVGGGPPSRSCSQVISGVQPPTWETHRSRFPEAAISCW